MTRAYVGLGANLGDRERTLRAAIDALGAEDGVEVVAVSALRETDPVGVGDQPRFLNGAAELETTLTARELLGRLLAVEQRFGRVRSPGSMARARSISTFSSTATRSWTSPASPFRTRTCTSAASSSSRSPSWLPASSSPVAERWNPCLAGYTEPACPTSTISTSTRPNSSSR